MEKQKKYYYVLVMTDNGPVFVTGRGEHHTAYWERLEKPRAFTKTIAEEIAYGLNLNFYQSYMVTIHHELESQPYRYSDGGFVWRWKQEGDDDYYGEDYE